MTFLENGLQLTTISQLMEVDLVSKHFFTTVLLAAMSCVGASAVDEAKSAQTPEEVVPEGEIVQKDVKIVNPENTEVEKPTQLTT